MNDVRVRVVAVDRRFQNSSAGQTRTFAITAPPNAPPAVQLTAPANNSSVEIARSVFLTADATDPDGTIQRVEFYQTSNVIGVPGVLSTTLIGSDTTAPYQVAWDTHFTGNFTITARAYDNRDAVTNSAPINFSVVISGGQAPLPINPPELDLPNDGQNFPVNANITLRAAQGTGSRPIVRMDFYNGTTLIASDTTAPYEIVWNNVPAGRYAIFARTIANNGAEATSKQADISVGTSGGPLPTSVVSRKAHGPAGVFDLDLPLTGSAGIECRSGGADRNHQVVFTFPTAVTLNGASVTPEAGKSASMIGPPNLSPDGRTVTLNLTNVSDVQTITATLSGVSDGASTSDVSVQMRVLFGDVTGNGTINASDVSQVKANAGATVGPANFRTDVTANGTINSSDLGAVKAASGAGAAGSPVR